MSRITKKYSKHLTRGKQADSNLPNEVRRDNVLLVILLLFVCLATAIAHWPALSAKAMYFDDEEYLTNNHLVQNPSWNSAKRFLTEILEPSTVKGYYQPLAMISLMMDHAMGGRKDNLTPFHRISLVLHVVNTGLIIILIYLLFGNAFIAACVGLLFGTHPMTVEPISWIAERKTLLAAFFALSCLMLYVLYTKKNDRKVYFACILAYILALMSKPTSVPLPALLILLDFWPLNRLNKQAIMEKIPLFIIGGAFAIVTIISQGRMESVVMPSEHSAAWIPLTLCHNIIFYLYKIIWPVNLSAYHTFPEPFDLSDPMVCAGVIGSCILIPLLILSLKWTRAALTGWLIFFVAIFPTLGVIGFTGMIESDKYVYLPAIGLLMALASFLHWLWGEGRFAAKQFTIILIILMLAGSESIATRKYLANWQDTVIFFEYMLKKDPDASALHNDLANELVSLGEFDKAIEHYNKGLQAAPDSFIVRGNLANLFNQQGKTDDATRLYQEALQINPNYIKAHDKLGTILNSQGRIDEAIEHYRQAVQLNPNYASVYNNLGSALATQGKFEEAIDYFNRSLQITSNDATVYCNLALAYQLTSRLDKAINLYRKALEIEPEHSRANQLLQDALATSRTQ